MNRRLLACAIALFLNIAVAQAANELDWSSISSDFIEIRKEPGLPGDWIRRWILDREDLKYDIGLEDSAAVPPDCHWKEFRRRHSELSLPVLTKIYWQTCEKAVQTGSTNPFLNTYRTLMMSWPIDEHPFVKRVFFHFPNGFRVPGMIALKDTKFARPTIVFRAGIFGNSQDALAERFLIMQLFEQGPFNVIFLDSLVSPETIYFNSRYSVGGLDEGLQNYQLIEQIKNSKEPISRLVSSLHLLGLSMGGHGLWLTLALDQQHNKRVKDAVGICPLVQFEKTFAAHAERRSFIVENLWAALRLDIFRGKVAGISVFHALSDAFNWVENNYTSPLTWDGHFKFPESLGVSQKTEFKKGNRFLPLLQDLRTPVTVFSSEHDEFVPFALNARELQKISAENPKVPLQVVPLRESFHCSIPGAYDWDEFSDLLVSQFKVDDKGMTTEHLKTPWKQGRVTRFFWPQDSATLKAELFADGEKREIDLPLARLDWAVGEKIHNWTEARALIRWARHNIESANTSGHLELNWQRRK